MCLGFEGMVNVDCAGRAGGLAFLWKKADEFSLLGFSQNHIDMAVLENKTPQWKITGFYSHLDRSQRSTTSDLPWCVIGDFNEICNNEAKQGTIPHLPQLIRNFYEALHDCQLQDIPLQGYPFTWERGRGTLQWVEERLDRAQLHST